MQVNNYHYHILRTENCFKKIWIKTPNPTPNYDNGAVVPQGAKPVPRLKSPAYVHHGPSVTCLSRLHHEVHSMVCMLVTWLKYRKTQIYFSKYSELLLPDNCEGDDGVSMVYTAFLSLLYFFIKLAKQNKHAYDKI